jgi:isoamylase
MEPEDWDTGFDRTVGVFLNGQGVGGRDARGERVTDDSFVLFFNAHDEGVTFALPSEEYAPAWELVVNTAGEGTDADPYPAGAEVDLHGKSLAVLRAYLKPEVEQAAAGASAGSGANAAGKPVL